MRVATLLLFVSVACANFACHRPPRTIVVVPGPWDQVGYKATPEQVIVRVCEELRGRAGSRSGANFGVEWCGRIYHATKGWAATEPFRNPGYGTELPSCHIPDRVRDLFNGPIDVWEIGGDYHNHPYGDSQFSQGDLEGAKRAAGGDGQTVSNYIRAMCSADGTAYTYRYRTGEIEKYNRSRESWETIGRALPPDYKVEMFPGKTW